MHLHHRQVIVFGLLVILLTAVSVTAQVVNVRVARNVPYVTGSIAETAGRSLDLYVPEGARKAPVMLFIHGGGWRGGSKAPDGLQTFVDMFLKRGMALVSVDYRLSPAVKHPAHIEDVAEAVAWLQKHGGDYGIDPTQLWLSGHSAGAHLAALLAVDPQYLARHQISTGVIKGVVAMSGLYDVAEYPNIPVGAQLYGMITQAFGEPFQPRRDASPAWHVGAHKDPAPPFLVAFAWDDLFGLDEQAKTFYTLLLKQGVPAQLVEAPDRTHGTIFTGLGRRVNDVDDLVAPAIDRFVDAVTSGRFARVPQITSSRGGSARMAAPPMKSVRDVRYFSGDGSSAKLNALDLFLPEGKTNVPAVFYVHGGGWRGGDKGTPQTLIDIFGRIGMAVVSTNYRVSPAVKHPTHVQDVARAFAWLYNHAAEHGIDRDRIYISGTSAGGHLVSLLALDTSYLRAENVPETAIKGVMSISGIYDFPHKAETGKVPTRREQGFGMDVQVHAQASPLTHVRPDAPPFLMTYTDRDIFLEKQQGHAIYDALRKAGVDARLLVIPDRTHFDQMDGIGIQLNLYDDALGPALVEFVLDRLAAQ